MTTPSAIASPASSSEETPRLSSLLIELRRRDPWLFFGMWANIGLAALAVVALPFDDRLVVGLNPWIKPFKFSISVAIYLATVGWLLEHIASRRLRWVISRGVLLSMAVEMPLIFLQAYRGTTSHYNIATAFDASVFSAMGTFIALNTVLVALLLAGFVFFAKPLPSLYRWSIQAGLVVFLLGSAAGGQMIGNMAHNVGVEDGGPGLPLVNWSTVGGDLRIAHGAGLHAIQFLPLFGFILTRRAQRVGGGRLPLVFGITIYVTVVAGLYLQAMAGRPLIPL